MFINTISGYTGIRFPRKYLFFYMFHFPDFLVS